MRVAADDRIRTGINHQARELLLTRIRARFVFETPMHECDHQIGMVFVTRIANIGHHLLVIAPSMSGFIHVSLETARKKFVIAQQCDPQTLSLKYQGLVRLA